MLKRLSGLLVVLLLVSVLACPFLAGAELVNYGFESGDLTAWEQNFSVNELSVTSEDAHYGNYGLLVQASGAADQFITQKVTADSGLDIVQFAINWHSLTVANSDLKVIAAWYWYYSFNPPNFGLAVGKVGETYHYFVMWWDNFEQFSQDTGVAVTLDTWATVSMTINWAVSGSMQLTINGQSVFSQSAKTLAWGEEMLTDIYLAVGVNNPTAASYTVDYSLDISAVALPTVAPTVPPLIVTPTPTPSPTAAPDNSALEFYVYMLMVVIIITGLLALILVAFTSSKRGSR